MGVPSAQVGKDNKVWSERPSCMAARAKDGAPALSPGEESASWGKGRGREGASVPSPLPGAKRDKDLRGAGKGKAGGGGMPGEGPVSDFLVPAKGSRGKGRRGLGPEAYGTGFHLSLPAQPGPSSLVLPFVPSKQSSEASEM